MSLMAVAVPILPGKTDQWRRWMDDLNGPRRHEYEESRRRLGIHERTFLQSTPQGDVAIVTFEGDDPEAIMRRMAEGTDGFSRWFIEQVRETCGIDPGAVQGPLPQLAIDSERRVQRKAA